MLFEVALGELFEIALDVASCANSAAGLARRSRCASLAAASPTLFEVCRRAATRSLPRAGPYFGPYFSVAP
jgi:hypothetical protein